MHSLILLMPIYASYDNFFKDFIVYADATLNFDADVVADAVADVIDNSLTTTTANGTPCTFSL